MQMQSMAARNTSASPHIDGGVSTRVQGSVRRRSIIQSRSEISSMTNFYARPQNLNEDQAVPLSSGRSRAGSDSSSPPFGHNARDRYFHDENHSPHARRRNPYAGKKASMSFDSAMPHSVLEGKIYSPEESPVLRPSSRHLETCVASLICLYGLKLPF